MAKQILANELAEIVTGLLIRPELLGELDSSEKHEEFIEAIGKIVADFCGGAINGVGPADAADGPELASTPMLSVWPNESMPSMERCVWAPYDPEGWDGHTNNEFYLEDDTPIDVDEKNRLRAIIRSLLTSTYVAQQESLRA